MLIDAASGPFGPHVLFVLLIALVLEAALGNMYLVFRVLPHPVKVIGNAVAFFDRKLNRPRRGEWMVRIRGILVVVLFCSVAWVVGRSLETVASGWRYGWLIEVACLVILLAQRELFDRVRDVATALERGLPQGRAALHHVAGRDPSALDRHGVARAAVESCAENFADAVVAPAFWYLMAGLPGLFIHKTVSTLDSMIGYRSPRYRAFGWASARLDDLLVLIPARLAGIILVIAAVFTPSGRPWSALTVMMRDAGNHSSPNAGWPEGAMAGAFGFSLGGTRRYKGHVAKDNWIGSGTARLTPVDIRRGLYLYVVGCLLLISLCAVGVAAWLAGEDLLAIFRGNMVHFFGLAE